MSGDKSPAEKAERLPDDDSAQQRERQHGKPDRNPFARLGRALRIEEYLDGNEATDGRAQDEADHIGRRVVRRPQGFVLGGRNTDGDRDHHQEKERPQKKTEEPHMYHPAPERILPRAGRGSHHAAPPSSAASFGRKFATRHGIAPGVALALACLSTGAASAATSSRCHIEVLSSEELPYALPGYWLLKATVRVTYPQGPAVVSTVVRNTPWQMVVRRGDTFWFDCERIRDALTISLAPIR